MLEELRGENSLLGILVGLVLHIAEIILEGAPAPEQSIEVLLRNHHRSHVVGKAELSGSIQHFQVMVDLLYVPESFYYKESEAPEVHQLQVKILYDKGREVMPGHFEEQGVGVDGLRRVEENKQLPLARVEVEFQVGRVGWDRIITQARVPEHTAHIRHSALEFLPLGQSLEICRGVFGHIRVGVALQHLHKRLAELVGLVLGHVGKRFQEHELGHEFAQGVLLAERVVKRVNPTVVILQICVESLVI